MKFLGVRFEIVDDQLIEIEEVNYITVYRGKKSHHVPVYHTTHGEYVQIKTLEDLEKSLAPRGFRRYDNQTLINENRVKERVGDKIIFIDGTYTYVAKKSNKREN